MSVSTEPLYCNVMKPTKDVEKNLDFGLADEQSSETYNEEKVYKVRLNLIPVFILECIALGCLAVLAYLLRFGSIFPVHIRSYNPCDPSLSYPSKISMPETKITLNIPPHYLYMACVAFPLILILLGEFVAFAFSRSPRKVVRAGCIPCKLHQVTRRTIRFTGTFLFGILATSIITDFLKLATGIQRPYFLDVCGINETRTTSSACAMPFGISECTATGAQVREARMSFPSIYASLSSYSAAFVMVYFHSMMAYRSSRLLRPTIVFLCAGIALVCSFSRVALHRNHWNDVIGGILLGSAIALYLGTCLLNMFREHDGAIRNCCYKCPNHSEGKSQPLFFRYFHIPRVSYQDRSGRSYSASDRNNLDYSAHSVMPLNAAFQRDLHQRVEDYSKRHGKQSAHHNNSEMPKGGNLK